MEGTQAHFQRLQEFSQSDEFGYLGPMFLGWDATPIFRAYLQQVAELMAQEQAMMQLQQAAQQFGEGMQRPGMPGPEGAAQPGAQMMPPVQGAELLDETLPSAGGGANP